jgi:hypothetical protein
MQSQKDVFLWSLLVGCVRDLISVEKEKERSTTRTDLLQQSYNLPRSTFEFHFPDLKCPLGSDPPCCSHCRLFAVSILLHVTVLIISRSDEATSGLICAGEAPVVDESQFELLLKHADGTVEWSHRYLPDVWLDDLMCTGESEKFLVQPRYRKDFTIHHP